MRAASVLFLALLTLAFLTLAVLTPATARAGLPGITSSASKSAPGGAPIGLPPLPAAPSQAPAAQPPAPVVPEYRPQIQGRPTKSLSEADAVTGAMTSYGSGGGGMRDLMCGCSFKYDPMRQISIVNRPSCGYVPRVEGPDANLVTWRRIVQPRILARGRACWTQGHPACEVSGSRYAGERCCMEVDEEFRGMMSDIYNFAPFIKEIDGAVGDARYAEIPGTNQLFGSCPVEYDAKAGIVEPSPAARGEIARVHLYMNRTWSLPLSDLEFQQFRKWSEDSPATAADQRRMRAIQHLQGNTNPFVK